MPEPLEDPGRPLEDPWKTPDGARFRQGFVKGHPGLIQGSSRAHPGLRIVGKVYVADAKKMLKLIPHE